MNEKGMKRFAFVIIIVYTFLTMNTFSFADVSSDQPISDASAIQLEPETVNGGYSVSVKTDMGWVDAGALPFTKNYEEKVIDLRDFITLGKPAVISITQKGGGSAQIDSVLAGSEGPAKVNNSIDTFLLKKLSAKDFDVIPVGAEGITVEFSSDITTTLLKLTARIEPVVISKYPFQYPTANSFKTINSTSSFCNYTLNSKVGSLNIDSQIEEVDLTAPFFKELCQPSTGHPDGYIYGWVLNDLENLYVAMDVTPDNTMDGDEDYAKVYIKTSSGIKEFKITVSENTWGSPGFLYNNRVAYQHKVYEFKIPLSEIGISNASLGEKIEIAFSAYGTMAITPTNSIFNKHPAAQEDIMVEFIFVADIGSSLISIDYIDINGDPQTLSSVTDFVYSGNQITINKSFLSTLPTSIYNFDFHYNISSVATLSVNVIDEVPIDIINSALSPATVGVSYLETLAASGGTAPYSWSASGLPDGLTMNASTGEISGTPVSYGSALITVTVSDSSLLNTSKEFILNIGTASMGPYIENQSGPITYNDTDITITLNLKGTNLAAAYMDSEPIAEISGYSISSKFATYEDSGTKFRKHLLRSILTLKQDYLVELDSQTHLLKLVFTDGSSTIITIDKR
ncbi:MAG: putative Ig domain-containing protein [Clostridia bacterium]|nr:putative Ig domain-containing protein [Clostridia bacterium]